MLRRSCIAAILASGGGLLWGQPAPILRIKDVKPGMKGSGRTVFSGGKVEEFQCEILGVLENVGPKQSIILVRLSGGPLEQTGVMQGMSGSPVYVNGRLVGAVALSFPFSKTPVAGVRPIEEMLQLAPAGRRELAWSNPMELAAALPKRQEVDVGPARLAEISTPLWMSGFTRATVEQFSPPLRASGLEPVQGVGGGGQPAPSTAAAPRLEPGSMISVQLVTGDMGIGADGTVTHVDGRRVYAFGHRFLAGGDTEMPFARAEVIALLPSLNSSFKISNPREWMGAITEDRSTAIAGELGRKAPMLPVRIKVNRDKPDPRAWTYNLNIVRDRLFAPLLVQMAVFSAIDATERTAGLSTIAINASLLLQGGESIPFSNLYAAEMGAPLQVSAALAAPVAAVLQSGFDSLKLRGLEIGIGMSNDKRQLTLDGVWSSKRLARPGETVRITALYSGERGFELTRTASYVVPVGASTGPLYFTVTDGPTANLAEFRQFLLAPPRSPEQLKAFLTGLHANNRPYIRVWRAAATLQVQGDNLPAPPPSMAAVLAKSSSQQPNSLVTEMSMDAAPYLFTGSKTIQVEVKE